jgi:L-ascorbate metabolism protein UlaG (beta-lactamase superfamily)
MTLAGKPELARPAALLRVGLLLAVGSALSACGVIEGIEGTERYSGPDSVIATAEDHGRDNVALIDGEAAIAYDPDGCQVWIIDDGIEGYSTPRFDPDTGLPVCDNKYPPGTVIGVYETTDAGISDRVSGPARNK